MITGQYRAEIVESPSHFNGFRTLARTDEGDVYDLTGQCVGFPKGIRGILYIDVKNTFYTSHVFIPDQKEVL